MPREDGRQQTDREARRASLAANLAQEAGKKAVAKEDKAQSRPASYTMTRTVLSLELWRAWRSNPRGGIHTQDHQRGAGSTAAVKQRVIHTWRGGI